MFTRCFSNASTIDDRALLRSSDSADQRDSSLSANPPPYHAVIHQPSAGQGNSSTQSPPSYGTFGDPPPPYPDSSSQANSSAGPPPPYSQRQNDRRFVINRPPRVYNSCHCCGAPIPPGFSYAVSGFLGTVGIGVGIGHGVLTGLPIPLAGMASGLGLAYCLLCASLVLNDCRAEGANARSQGRSPPPCYGAYLLYFQCRQRICPC